MLANGLQGQRPKLLGRSVAVELLHDFECVLDVRQLRRDMLAIEVMCFGEIHIGQQDFIDGARLVLRRHRWFSRLTPASKPLGNQAVVFCS